MKNRLLILFMILLAGCQAAIAQNTAQISAAFFSKYPEKPSAFCTGCTIEVNPYYSTITDNKLGYSRVTYGNFTPAKEQGVIAAKVDRTKYGVWHPYPGQPDLGTYYNDINKGIKSSTAKYAKGHYDAYILCAYTVEGAVISCTYVVNEGLENQGQNAGTEGEVEALTRALVGSKSSDAAKVKYSGPTFQKVDYWKGGWVDIGKAPTILTDKGISRVYADVYWNLLSYGGQMHAYWFPNNISASTGYKNYEIPVATLIQRLGFNPTKVLPATN